jgi:hypothetical protein
MYGTFRGGIGGKIWNKESVESFMGTLIHTSLLLLSGISLRFKSPLRCTPIKSWVTNWPKKVHKRLWPWGDKIASSPRNSEFDTSLMLGSVTGSRTPST